MNITNKCTQNVTNQQKLNNINDININTLKFTPIIDQTNTYTYHAAQVISEYLKPLHGKDETMVTTSTGHNFYQILLILENFAYHYANLPHIFFSIDFL